MIENDWIFPDKLAWIDFDIQDSNERVAWNIVFIFFFQTLVVITCRYCCSTSLLRNSSLVWILWTNVTSSGRPRNSAACLNSWPYVNLEWQETKNTFTSGQLGIFAAVVICDWIIYLQITFLMEATEDKENTNE